MTGAGSTARETTDQRRWVALVFIALAQLMGALDATIVSIALPSAQAGLHASAANRQWAITAYTLAFGGLLLLGGRLGDRFGRKRAFLAGLAGFAVASALGGAATSFAMLIAARALEGAFAALLIPTALSLLAVTFTEPRERATAFAVFGSIAGSGAAVGLLLGGALTEYLSWRWCLYVNIPIALAAAAGGWAFIPSGAPAQIRSGLDLPGVGLVTGALVALVDGCTEAISSGWGAPLVIGLLAGAGVLLAAFVAREATARSPLLPLRVVLDRNRGGANLAVLLAVGAMFGAFLLLTYYLQVGLAYTPLQAGLAFLPLTVASQAASWLIARRLMPRLRPRLLVGPGLATAALGMLLLTRLQVGSGYFPLVLLAELLVGAGLSCAMVPAFSLATLGVRMGEAGVASAAVMTAQQVGGSIGTALLNSVAAGTTAAYLVAHGAGAISHLAALIHGYAAATAWGGAALLIGAALALLLINAPPPAARHGTEAQAQRTARSGVSPALSESA